MTNDEYWARAVSIYNEPTIEDAKAWLGEPDDPNMVVFADDVETTICQGATGSPLFRRFTNVAYFRDWINSKLKTAMREINGATFDPTVDPTEVPTAYPTTSGHVAVLDAVNQIANNQTRINDAVAKFQANPVPPVIDQDKITFKDGKTTIPFKLTDVKPEYMAIFKGNNPFYKQVALAVFKEKMIEQFKAYDVSGAYDENTVKIEIWIDGEQFGTVRRRLVSDNEVELRVVHDPGATADPTADPTAEPTTFLPTVSPTDSTILIEETASHSTTLETEIAASGYRTVCSVYLNIAMVTLIATYF